MNEIYIVEFTSPHSPVPTYHPEYFYSKRDVESFLNMTRYIYDFGSRYHLEGNSRYCANIVSFSNSTYYETEKRLVRSEKPNGYSL